MTLKQILDITSGSYELTVCSRTISGSFYYYCEDEGIPFSDAGEVNYSDYINYWDVIKEWIVSDVHITDNRNYNGAAMWLTVEQF